MGEWWMVLVVRNEARIVFGGVTTPHPPYPIALWLDLQLNLSLFFCVVNFATYICGTAHLVTELQFLTAASRLLCRWTPRPIGPPRWWWGAALG